MNLQKRYLLMGGAVLTILLTLAAGLLFWGRRPFRGLEAADIAAATVLVGPPDVTLELDAGEIETLADLLADVRITRPDQSYSEYAGQTVLFTVTMADGTAANVTAYNPFLIIDGTGWRTAYAPCEALNRSHSDAEECVNDTYLRTWNAIPPARPSAFRAWLGRIVRNLSLDRWKQSRTAKRGGDGMEVLLGELDDCVPEPHGTEKTMEDQEIASLISAFLRRQSPESRIIFLRRYWYGQSVADIAAGMNCGEGKVKSSLFRTRKALRTYLEQEEVFL